ncbi:MAG: prolipoprotein diacylglyceryl transferase [[Eubacterium] siraeum]|nr:prolipoprotein diacylglyceryl transferase [[Eubacterium] siraeum]
MDFVSTILATANDPTTAFSIGSIEIKWYALFIVCAMILGLVYVCVECKKINLNTDDAIELFLWIIPLAIIFARILYVIPNRVDEYFPWHSWDDFVHFIAIWEGGLTIIGGIVGGVLGGIFFAIRHRKQCNFGNVADLVIVPLFTGQIIGRLGNFVNQEAFGLPITNPHLQFFPFGVYITRPQGYSAEYADIIEQNRPGWFCATFFYEMVWNFIGLVICFKFWQSGKNKKYPGLMLLFYFFWYLLGRLWLENLRLDSSHSTKVAASILCSLISVLALVLGVLYVLGVNSRQSYKRVRSLALAGELDGAALTEYDVKNYLFVEKVVKNPKNPLKLIYGKEEYIALDFASLEYYRVPKHYRRRFKELKKSEAFSR